MPGKTEPSHLSPTLTEMGVSLLSLLHIVLVALVVVQLVRGKLTLPHGVFGLVVLLFVPVVGPLLVLSWQGRVNRYRVRAQHPVT